MDAKKSAIATALAMFISASILADDYQLERLEPPFWWQGFKHQELQLMVYGPAISDLSASVDYAGVSISKEVRTDNPNYLFVYLVIAATAKVGSFEIRFSNANSAISHRYSLLQKNPDPAHARGFSSADSIYLVTPDRFANGNPGNDNAAGLGDPVDRSETCGRHGGDIAGMAGNLEYIADMGFTAIWMNPVLENAMPKCSYHGYATTDFYRVDPRFGSNDEFRSFVKHANAMGIGVIMDMIVNHSGSGHWWIGDLPAADWFNSPDQHAITSHQHSVLQDPYASNYDVKAFADGWFVDTMPDLNQRNPLLADYLRQNAIWWIEFLGLSGIRMDTYAYPDKQFMATWSGRIMQEYPDFNIVGEEWSVNPVLVSYWQNGKKNRDGYMSFLPSLMDFPLQETLVEVLLADTPEWGSSWSPLYQMLANDVLYPDPGALVIFPDNHDMSRIFTQLNEDYDLFRMAMVYFMTMRGTPQIYYGTEILMHNRGTEDDGVIRSDFPGGWVGDPKNAFTGKGLTQQQKRAQDLLRRLLNWRKFKAVIHQGQLMHFAPIGETYVYFRYDATATVMVIMNKENKTVTLDTPRFAERLGGAEAATDVLSGARFDMTKALEVPARGVLLLELK